MGFHKQKTPAKKNTIVDDSEILLTSWGWFIRLFTGFYTFQVVVWDVFHQQYYHSKGTPTYAWSIPQTPRFTPKWKEILLKESWLGSGFCSRDLFENSLNTTSKITKIDGLENDFMYCVILRIDSWNTQSQGTAVLLSHGDSNTRFHGASSGIAVMKGLLSLNIWWHE